MKVVLDTNVIVAAFAARGLSHSLFELCLDRHTVICSEHILKEMESGLRKKLRLPEAQTGEIVSFLRAACQVLDFKPLPKPTCRDADDDAILALALSSGADAIVTGDDDLLVLKTFRKIPVLTPRQFWELLKKPNRN